MDQIHLDPPVEGVIFTNIAVEVAPTGWVPPRWPSSRLNYGSTMAHLWLIYGSNNLVLLIYSYSDCEAIFRRVGKLIAESISKSISGFRAHVHVNITIFIQIITHYSAPRLYINSRLELTQKSVKKLKIWLGIIKVNSFYIKKKLTLDIQECR